MVMGKGARSRGMKNNNGGNIELFFMDVYRHFVNLHPGSYGCGHLDSGNDENPKGIAPSIN